MDGITLTGQSGFYAPIIITGNNLAECWENACRGLMNHGVKRFIEAPEYKCWTMDGPVFVYCKDASAEPRIHPKAPVQPGQAEEYAKNIIEGMSAENENGFDYTYFSRLRKHWDCPLRAMVPSIVESEEELEKFISEETKGKCVLQQIDQVQKTIETLRRDPTRRSIVMNTWYPIRDLEKFGKREKSSSPCVTMIQPQIIDNKLHLYVIMKTNDLYSAWNLNAFGMVKLQEFMAKELGVGIGSYTHFCASMNIYEEVFGLVKDLIEGKKSEDKPKITTREGQPMPSQMHKAATQDAVKEIFRKAVED